MFWEFPVTWKDAPESGIQLELSGSWAKEFAIIAPGTSPTGLERTCSVAG